MIRGLPFIVPGKFWTGSVEVKEGISRKSISEIIHQRVMAWITTLLLIIVHNFVEIPTYKPTKGGIRVSRGNFIKKTPRHRTVTLYGITIKTNKIK